MMEQNKIELFARYRVEGWDAWGDEVDGKKEVKIKPKLGGKQLELF